MPDSICNLFDPFAFKTELISLFFFFFTASVGMLIRQMEVFANHLICLIFSTVVYQAADG